MSMNSDMVRLLAYSQAGLLLQKQLDKGFSAKDRDKIEAYNICIQIVTKEVLVIRELRKKPFQRAYRRS